MQRLKIANTRRARETGLVTTARPKLETLLSQPRRKKVVSRCQMAAVLPVVVIAQRHLILVMKHSSKKVHDLHAGKKQSCRARAATTNLHVHPGGQPGLCEPVT